MKIVFIINRSVYYRYFAPLITEGLKHNHSIECWHDYTHPSTGSKGYHFPSLNNSPFYNRKNKNLTFKKINNKIDYLNLISTSNNINYFVSLHPITSFKFNVNEQMIKNIYNKWCILMHTEDSFMELSKYTDVVNYKYKPNFFIFSQFFYELGKKWLDKYHPKTSVFLSRDKTNIIFNGPTMLSESNKSINQNLVREKFGLYNKKILIYLPYAYQPNRYNGGKYGWEAAYGGLHINEFMNNKRDGKSLTLGFLKLLRNKFLCSNQIISNSNALRWTFNRWNEKNVIKSIRQFCDKNNLYLVVKSRKKFPITEKVRKIADLVIEDSEIQQHPSIYQELLSIASIAVGTYSSAVLEAVYQNVPFVNLEIPEFTFQDKTAKFWFNNNEGSMYNFKGVVSNFTIPEAISSIKLMKLEELKMKTKNQKEYLLKFTNIKNQSPSESFYKFLNLIN